MPSYLKILLGMLFGLFIGLLSIHFNFYDALSNWFSPLGEIFMRLLKMIALPLVLISLIKGVGGLNDVANLTSIGLKTIIVYSLTTVCAIAIGLALVLTFEPGKLVSQETSESLTSSYATTLDSQIESLDQMENSSPLQPLVDLFPENLFASLTENGAMLQIIIIAMLTGCAVIMAGKERSKAFMDFIDSADAVVLSLIDIIMKMAPIGVAALIANMIIGSAGDMSVLQALGMYALTVIIGLFALMYLFYPLLVHLFTRVKVQEFIKAVIPVQLLAFTTSSSAATLSTTFKVSNEVLRLPKKVTSFTLPVGTTINMDGTSCYQAIGVVFIAQAMGMDLSIGQLLTIVVTTTLSSIGTPAVPSGSIVISMMVLTSIGIPAEGLALIIGLDRPLDMLRTSVNVTGDIAVSAIISKEK